MAVNPQHNNGFPILEGGPKLVETLEDTVSRLTRKRTLQLTSNEHGIFPASSSQGELAPSGMQNAWLRDNAHIISSKRLCGKKEEAIRSARGNMKFAATQSNRFEAIIRKPRNKSNTQERPHIRYNASTLAATDQPWGHAQNDAWGFIIWIFCTLMLEEKIELLPDEEETLALFVHYLRAIGFENDEDHGTWEESPKVNSSSIAACIAGLTAIKRLVASRTKRSTLDSALKTIDPLIERGRASLNRTLPFEAPPIRYADAALLFAIYPTEVVEDRNQQDLVLALIQARLIGPRGCRRYIGDSYYCQDFDKWLRPEQLSNDHSLSLTLRDQLLVPGCEAQWCLFDPILSVVYGQRFLAGGDLRDFEQQLHFANRSISQITEEGECPEMYYLKGGEWVPNPHTPLLWTQANLAVAMHVLQASALTRRVRGGK